jgi:hypothetical protein
MRIGVSAAPARASPALPPHPSGRHSYASSYIERVGLIDKVGLIVILVYKKWVY